MIQNPLTWSMRGLFTGNILENSVSHTCAHIKQHKNDGLSERMESVSGKDIMRLKESLGQASQEDRCSGCSP